MERIEVIKGDITKLSVDAIVNAANTSLLGGGGVDGAIHAAAGVELLEACRALGGCETGEAKLTEGFLLPSKWVIHTVGPVWRAGSSNEDQLLYNCYDNALKLAAEKDVKTIAFPAISTGVYGFPLERATQIAFNAIWHFLRSNTSLEKVIFVCFSDTAYDYYQKLAHYYKGEAFRETMEAKLKQGEHHTWLVKDYNRLNQNQE